MKKSEIRVGDEMWIADEITNYNVTRVTYANIFVTVGCLENGKGFYECRVFTTEQSRLGDIYARMRNFGNQIWENDVERIELMGIVEALKYVPYLCAVNVYVSSEKIKDTIEGFYAVTDKAGYPNADLLYPIRASGAGITVFPSPFSPILELMCDHDKVEKILAEQFRNSIELDIAENAKFGQYAATQCSDWNYVYEMSMPVYEEWSEDE